MFPEIHFVLGRPPWRNHVPVKKWNKIEIDKLIKCVGGEKGHEPKTIKVAIKKALKDSNSKESVSW